MSIPAQRTGVPRGKVYRVVDMMLMDKDVCNVTCKAEDTKGTIYTVTPYAYNSGNPETG